MHPATGSKASQTGPYPPVARALLAGVIARVRKASREPSGLVPAEVLQEYSRNVHLSARLRVALWAHALDQPGKVVHDVVVPHLVHDLGRDLPELDVSLRVLQWVVQPALRHRLEAGHERIQLGAVDASVGAFEERVAVHRVG